jgi:hypothetical protein
MSVTAEVMNNLRIDREVNDKLRMQLAFPRHRVSVRSLCRDRGSFHEKARSSNGRSVCSPKHRGLRAGRQGQGPAACGHQGVSCCTRLRRGPGLCAGPFLFMPNARVRARGSNPIYKFVTVREPLRAPAGTRNETCRRR